MLLLAITKLTERFEKGLISADEFFWELVIIAEDADESGDERVHILVDQMITCFSLTRSAYEDRIEGMKDALYGPRLAWWA